MDNPDVLRKIALELPPYDLISLCASKKSFYKDICKNNQFWRLKLEKDFPEVFNYILNLGLSLKNPKSTYMRVFTQLSSLIEKYTTIYLNKKEEEIDILRDVRINKDKVKDKIYKVLYSAYSDLRKLKIVDSYEQVVTQKLNKYIKEYNLYEIESKILLNNLREIVNNSPINRYL